MMFTLNPFRSHQERSQAPTSLLARSTEFAESTDRRDSIDEWLYMNHDQSVLSKPHGRGSRDSRRRGSTKSQRHPSMSGFIRRGSIGSRRCGSIESKGRPSIECQGRSSFGEWEVIEDDNNHNVVEYLEDCNAPVQDPACTCMTCVGFFDCQADPEAFRKLHRAWHRQFRGLQDIEEDDELDEDEYDGEKDEEAEEDEEESPDDDGEEAITITHPPRAHLAHSQDFEEDDEEDPFSLHKRSSSKNYPSCENGGSLVLKRSWAKSFTSFNKLFDYIY